METRTGMEFDPFLCCRFREARSIVSIVTVAKERTSSIENVFFSKDVESFNFTKSLQ